MVAYKCPFSSTSCVKIFELFIIFCWLISLKSSCELLSSLCVHPSFVKFSHFNLPPFPLAYYMTGIRLVTKCYKCCRQIKKSILYEMIKKKKKIRNWSCLRSIFCHKSIISDQYNKNTVKKTHKIMHLHNCHLHIYFICFGKMPHPYFNQLLIVL